MTSSRIALESYVIPSTNWRLGLGLRCFAWLIALMLVFGILRQDARAQLLIGSTTAGTQVDGNANGSAEAYKFTASATGSLGSLSLFLDSSNTATKVFLGLYSNTSGHPGTLLTSGSSSSLTNGAWNTITVPAASVTSGTVYWIAILSTAGTAFHFREGTSSCSGADQESASSTLTSLPATWSVGTNFTGTGCPLSAHGDVTKTLSATPTSLSFGNVLVNQNSSLSTTIKNTGSGSVSITAPTERA